jgi:succinyl-diaminopimelate desuccinylase
MNEVEISQELVRINSENPPGNETSVARYIRDFLEDVGICAEIIEFEKNRCDVVASVGKGRGMMLNGHMDTVPAGDLGRWRHDPFEGKVVGGKLYGRGASDMKGGIASILAAVKDMPKDKFKGRLLLTFVADEETQGKGSEYLIKNKREIFHDVKYGIMGECTNFDVKFAQKGILHLRVSFKGKASHGAMPEKGVNAVYKAADFIEEVEKLSENLKRKRNPVLGSGTISVGTISGGTKVNIVPDACSVEIDRRLIPGESPRMAVGQIRHILSKLKLNANVKILRARYPMQLDKDMEIIKLLRDVAKARLLGDAGYTESELFYRDANVPCISFGPGLESQAHVADEYIPIKSLQRATKIYKEIIRRVCL